MIAPGVGSNASNITAVSVVDDDHGTLGAIVDYLGSGDFINVNTNSGASTQACWCNIVEF